MSNGHEGSLTFGQYLEHHLSFWTVGGDTGFWRVNLDSIIMSFLIGIVLAGLLYWQVRKINVHKPTKFQIVVEMFVTWVNDTTKSFIHGSNTFFAPLAGVTFLWILAMNIIDFIPVDWIPSLVQLVAGDEHAKFRALPTADANITFGIDLGVFIIIVFAGIKSKGLGYIKNFTHHPLPGVFAIPINIFLEVLGFCAEFLSLSLRLFGNMYAGEVIFILIAAMYSLGFILGFSAIAVSFAWALLHVLIVSLQAFIFMMLTIVYISKAWNKEEH